MLKKKDNKEDYKKEYKYLFIYLFLSKNYTIMLSKW